MKERKVVEFCTKCSEVKRPQDMKPLPVAGREEGRRGGNKKEMKMKKYRHAPLNEEDTF